jgi:MYXO-CTERM domain-containing protein
VERTLVAFTTTLLASIPAQAAHPLRTDIAAEAPFVESRVNSRGFALARQAIRRSNKIGDDNARATSRTIYLNKDGITVFPGNNDARTDRSSIAPAPVFITPWEIDDEMWDDTVACMRDLYSRFDVAIVTEDPGDVPHIEAVFGGHPLDVDLPDYVAGVSPFATDCSTIENSIVFTFTDVLPDDAQLMCEVMAQEIAHSYGLDHQLTPEDPMTYLEYYDNRSFQDEMADCGEFESRECGIDGSVCRDRQNSVALLTSRLGRRGAEDDPPEPLTTTTEPEGGGCATSGSGAPLAGLAVIGLLLRRRRRV